MLPTPPNDALAQVTVNDDDLVMTPGGQRARSIVHLISPGTILDGEDGKFRNLTPEGESICDFGTIPRRQTGKPLMPGNVSIPQPITHDSVAAAVPKSLGQGWITFADFTPDSELPVSVFSTSWVVPPAPMAANDQLVFIFPGIQNETMILQPVLQWGISAAGGGNHWAVASWYADGQNGKAFHTKLITVQPGNTLTGIITLTGSTSGKFNYRCEFVDIPNSSLSINKVDKLTDCCQTLECYGIKKAMDYPSTFRTSMHNISLTLGTESTPPFIDWRLTNSVTDCGQHSIVISNSAVSGEVDLCHGVIGPASLSILSVAPTTLDVFGVDATSSALLHKRFSNSTWSPTWENLGGPLPSLQSPPVTTSWGNRINVFALGGDLAVWWKFFDGRTWSPSANGWISLSGKWASPPAAVSWGPNRIDVFVLGDNKQMYWKWFDGTKWEPSPNGWTSLGGNWTTQPVAVSWAPNRIDLFTIGTNQKVYHKSFDGSKWSPSTTGWESLGGTFNSAPAVVSWAPGRLDIICLGTDDTVYHKWFVNNTWGPSATSWQSLGAQKFQSLPVITSWGHDRLDLFGLNALDGTLLHKFWDSGSWGPNGVNDVDPWENLFGLPNSVPAVACWGVGRIDVVAVQTDGNPLAHLSFEGGVWGGGVGTWDALGGTFGAA